MAKRENQKQKLLRLLEIFITRTDEERGITMSGILSALSDYGIDAERKSIYDDFKNLEAVGFSVVNLGGNPPEYTLAERIFELPELKLLVDAVQSSRFITAEKSKELIDKLKGFAGGGSARELDRQVVVEDRVKTENIATLYIVDAIHRAINQKCQLAFKYFDYDINKKKVYRHSGEKYTVSPKALMWSDENYYLVAYDERDGVVKNFRVDKMERAAVTDTPHSLSADRYRLDPADYSRKIFGMYGGKEELVTIEARERLAGVIIDRFGKGGSFFRTPFGFRTSVKVMVSPTFFAWVMSFGADMRILGPDKVREDFIASLEKIRDIYCEGQTDGE
ncbi:MAG: WYL domain-containing protein [Clostridia bacterium]|nr:WYL domain-containing protein [Clostridia bacterium]